MVSVHLPQHPHRHPRVMWSRFKVRWPFVFWCLMVVTAIYLYYHGGRFSGMSGTVEAVREDAAPLETARLRTLHVIVGQEVHAGDVVAEMDTSILDAEMLMNKLQEERRFAAAVADINMRLQETRIRQAEAEGEINVLNDELTRMDDLLNKHLIDAQTVTRVRARHESLARALKLYPDLITGLEEELANARNRMQTVAYWFSEGSSNAVAGGWTADAEIQQQFSLMQMRQNSYTLRAKSDGVISRVNYKPGDIVDSGNAVVSLLVKNSEQVVGFLPESNARFVSIGMTSYLASATGKGPLIPARVAALTPEIQGLPNRANPYPGIAFRGRQVILTPMENHDLIPGESVSIHLDRPGLTLAFDQLKKEFIAWWRKEK